MTEQNNTEQGWMGVGKMTDEGAAKFGHVRKDLRARRRNPESTLETTPRKTYAWRNMIRRALRASGIDVLLSPRPEEE